MNSFIYVFSLEAHQILLDRGFTLWQGDGSVSQGVYVFINDGQGDLSDVEHIATNRMTF